MNLNRGNHEDQKSTIEKRKKKSYCTACNLYRNPQGMLTV